jgi:hypothetical protein
MWLTVTVTDDGWHTRCILRWAEGEARRGGRQSWACQDTKRSFSQPISPYTDGWRRRSRMTRLQASPGGWRATPSMRWPLKKALACMYLPCPLAQALACMFASQSGCSLHLPGRIMQIAQGCAFSLASCPHPTCPMKHSSIYLMHIEQATVETRLTCI